MSNDLEKARDRAKTQGVIRPGKPLDPEDVKILVQNEDRSHPDPMINYLIGEARQLRKDLDKQQKTLAIGLRNVENMRKMISMTEGAIQKTESDISHLHKFAVQKDTPRPGEGESGEIPPGEPMKDPAKEENQGAQLHKLNPGSKREKGKKT